ncbi:hypothetical protein J3Q64DRAFT_1723564 [Phycomyces blakesleeanus]|uniref:F-box domain-containing protein n=2 Tax=Phycomyces blakesleeanus TaxID=4837 RepID=A0A167QUS0_PHYB8|nr:hypothetical protein PHYBLDRAFT_178537 [Phycomyces blakesleeanus NRRL 1555(-)]OAD80308.1 hypothetical protein PHYBLDRAFT_178537 [Phycomyces blakesleeanus NRRL 1555(-)]|eukprot:XP_018298348.1 hypothetical protein PHYBLDRAFT_178537 [Phycomyces blakesleeanus NRRL 1555(-)]
MLLSEFPQELISNIPPFLALKDKGSCSLVCKTWRIPFQESMHSDLIICNKYQLHEMFEIPKGNETPKQDTSHLLRFLTLRQNMDLSDEQLYTLQYKFQNIKYLHVGADSLSSVNFGITADWYLWRLLRELSINLGDERIPDAENAYLEIILRLPLLTYLKIVRGPLDPTRLTFTLNDLETIHTHLLHLNRLELSSDLLPLSETDLTRITKISPANKMTLFGINTKSTDHRWLCYFARKYPNIRTLNFSTSNCEPELERQRDSIITLFKHVSHPFQHLKTVNIGNYNCPRKEYLLFWDMIAPCQIPLKNISLIARKLSNTSYSSEELEGLSIDIMKLCLQQFSNTLESVSIEYDYNDAIPIDLNEIVGTTCNLVHLKLDTALVSFKLDLLLDKTPCLKSLGLKKAHVEIDSITFSNPKRHALQSLKIFRSQIVSDVLRYLSFHCRELNVLDLVNTKVFGSISSTTGCNFIDMTYTRFKSLLIRNTEFIIKENEVCNENIDITVITHPVNDMPPKDDNEPSNSPVSIGLPHIKARYHWFYRERSCTMKAFSKSQGSRVGKFFAEFERKKENALKTNFYLDQVNKKKVNWKRNCVYGYTKIKCGYVADCHIEAK